MQRGLFSNCLSSATESESVKLDFQIWIKFAISNRMQTLNWDFLDLGKKWTQFQPVVILIIKEGRILADFVLQKLTPS